MTRAPKITDFNFVLSTTGNAYFSGLSFGDLWDAVMLSENAEQLDAAVSAKIHLDELLKKR